MILTTLANLWTEVGLGDGLEDFTNSLDTIYVAGVQALSMFIGLLAFCCHCGFWQCFFRRYRARMFAMRTGRYFFPPNKFDETGASSFIGYQAAFMICSLNVCVGCCFFLIVFFGSFGVMAVSALMGGSSSSDLATGAKVVLVDTVTTSSINNPFRVPVVTTNLLGGAGFVNSTVAHVPLVQSAGPLSFQSYAENSDSYADQVNARITVGGLPPLIWWLVLGFFFQYGFNKCVWFSSAFKTRNGDIRGRWLKFRFWYAIYEYLLILPNIAIGFFMVFIRSIISFFMWIYFTFSIDIGLIPSLTGVEYLDAGHAAYVAVARNDHRYNNPVVMVFLEALQDELRRSRLFNARYKILQHMRKRAIARKKGLLDAFVQAQDEEGGGGSSSMKTQLNEFAKLEADAERTLINARRRQKAVRKWQLAGYLVMNPALQVYRASNSSMQGIADVNDMEVMNNSASSVIEGAGNALKGAAYGTGAAAG